MAAISIRSDPPSQAAHRHGGFADALRAYARFAGADRLDWAPHLTAEKRIF